MALDRTAGESQPLDVTVDRSMPRAAGPSLAATVVGPSPGLASTAPVDATIARALPDWTRAPLDGLTRGTAVGRYVLLDRVGAGGMGQVFAAYDPELDRKVAIKRVLTGGEASAVRLLREAQALARLAHPNVVAIHDVGTHAGDVWIAMEFVVGATLGGWARAAPRRWTEVLRVLLDAARGVAAAHAAGLVHRDLKPDNVMIGDDDRVRVMDFGLVHGHGASPAGAVAASSESHPGSIDSRAPTAELTRIGDVLGTPAYMAPEQWRGEHVGAPADQFGWAVMAWELLHGERPFAGDSVEELRAVVLAGRRRPPPRGRRVPPWLRRIVERGLASDPRQRWPDMAALVTALERGRSQVRRRIGLALLLTVTALVGAGLGLRRWQVAQQVAACEAAGAEVTEIWNDETRQGLRAAFMASDQSFREAATRVSSARLDAQASAWQAARTEVCRRSDLDRSWRADTSERALWCLEERRLELSSLVDAFVRADVATVRAAVEAASKLSPIAACVDETQLQRGPAPPQARDEIHAIRSALAHANSTMAVGKWKEALMLATAAGEQADAVGWPPLQAEARGMQGTLHMRLRARPDALRASKEAYLMAARAGAWHVAARAAMTLMDLHKMSPGDDEVRAWADHAGVAISHAGDATGLLEGRRLSILAYDDLQTGALDQALAGMRAALALDEAGLGSEDHPTIAKRLYGLAYIHMVRHEPAQALPLAIRAAAIADATIGPTHPETASTLRLLAMVHLELHDPPKALPLTRRALAIEEATHGPTSPLLLDTLAELGRILVFLGEYPQAIAVASRAVALAETTDDPTSLAVATHILAERHAIAGELSQARDAYERALAGFEQVHGAEHEETVDSALALARVLTALGEYPRARALFARGMAHDAEGGGFRSLVNLAALELRTADLAAARELLARAQARSEAPEVRPEWRAEMHEVLGLVHAAAGEHRTARTHFEAALVLGEQVYGREHPVVAHHLVRLAGAWLAEHAASTAMPMLERAVAIDAVHALAPRTRARAQFYLARALVESGGDPARALTAANHARGFLRKTDAPGAEDELAELEAWLVRHGLDLPVGSTSG